MRRGSKPEIETIKGTGKLKKGNQACETQLHGANPNNMDNNIL